MATVLTPVDTGIASYTISKDPDLGNEVSFDRNDRQLVSAGGVMHILEKGPVAQGWPLSFRGLSREEIAALDAYIKDDLIGSLKRFRIQWGTHRNLLTQTIDLGQNPPWQYEGTTQDPTSTYPSSVLAPDFSMTALQIAFDDWATTGADQKLIAYAEEPEGEAVDVTTETVTIGVWLRAAAGITLTGSDELQIVTDSEVSSASSVNLTDTWSWHSLTHTFATGGANLAFSFGNVDPAAAHTVHVWQPQLVLASSTTAAAYQVIPETAFGIVDLRFGDPPLTYRERLDNAFDVRLNLFKIGTP